MLILALETTGKYASAALIDENGSIEAASSETEMNHLSEILGLASDCITSKGCERSDITHVAASVGPGSFTGIRIGVSIARTLAQMLGLPCISVSSLEGMALRVVGLAGEQGCEYICPMINARRHQAYAGIFKLEDGKPVEYKPQKQYMIEEIIDEAKELAKEAGRELEAGAGDESEKNTGCKILFTGDGVDAYREIIEESEGFDYEFTPEELRYQSAGEIAMKALEKCEQGETLDYEELFPNYMRLSEAEQRLRDGSLSKKIRK